jgi:RNA recognition motif. (a.k.a. RRM, RBD, or RNP domain)
MNPQNKPVVKGKRIEGKGFSPDTTQNEMFQTFSKYGAVKKIEYPLTRDRTTNKDHHTGSATVSYAWTDSHKALLKDDKNVTCKGHPIQIKQVDKDGNYSLDNAARREQEKKEKDKNKSSMVNYGASGSGSSSRPDKYGGSYSSYNTGGGGGSSKYGGGSSKR